MGSRKMLLGPALLLALGSLGAGCAGNQSSGSEGAQQWVGQLQVENRSSSDMDIYVVRRGDRLRLGLAPSNKTTNFNLSPAQVAGGSVRFVAVPLAGGPGEAARSDPVNPSPRDTIVLTIPPP